MSLATLMDRASSSAPSSVGSMLRLGNHWFEPGAILHVHCTPTPYTPVKILSINGPEIILRDEDAEAARAIFHPDPSAAPVDGGHIGSIEDETKVLLDPTPPSSATTSAAQAAAPVAKTIGAG